MKAVFILAAAAVAFPALAQTQASPQPSLALGVPTCVTNGTCPALTATISRQLGMAAPAAPAAPAVGGPFDPVAQRAATTARTMTDYPPCRPGPGDDRCIQLYERGVRR
jgi:hypothetical protein